MLTTVIVRLWVMSLQACILIFVVLMARALLKKYPKVYAYCLWGLVGLRLLCPVFIETSFSLQPDMQNFVESAVGDASPVSPENDRLADIGIKQPDVILDKDISGEGLKQPLGNGETNTDLSNGTGTGSNANSSDNQTIDMIPADDTLTGNEGSTEEPGVTKSFDKEKAYRLLSTTYIVGIAIIAGLYIVQYINIRRRIAVAVKDGENVWLCENIQSPFVIGIIRPRIILPYGLSETERCHILKHEKMHIKHHDPLIRVLGILCIILHWWNPLVWLAVHKMNQDMEMYCDEVALKEASSTERKAYANTLLSFSVRKSGFSVGLAFGESNTERRVENIMKKRKKSFVIIGAIAVFAIFCVVAFLTIPGDNEDKGQETTTEQPTTTPEQPTTEPTTTTESQGGAAGADKSDMNIFYELFLKNESFIVRSPYDENVILTVMDDRKYESEFKNAKKSYALVDVDKDGWTELIFRISAYPSELMYIIGVYSEELVCFDVMETHTKNISFGVYDSGYVWWSQNYDGYEKIFYTYTTDGKREEVIRFTEEDEAEMAAYEGEEPEWFDWSVYETPANKLFNKFLSGEINAEGNGLMDSFNISELDMSGESWESYSIGDRLDLDNDGEDELILSGPYGGMYLDASGDKVKVFEMGDGTASNLSYTYSDNAVWVVHSDTMHAGRKVYRLDKYMGADKIVESATLAIYYSADSGYDTKTYYYNDEEISDKKYTELYQKFFGTVSIEDQIIIIEQNINMWKLSPDYANEVYSYAVTDLDGNGRLEVIASNMGGTGAFTYSHFYEVNEQFDGLVECETKFVEGDSQPDIIETTVDVYYDQITGKVYYIEHDLIKMTPGEYHIIQSALSLNGGKVEVNVLAREIQRYGEATGSITYEDSHGTEITEKAFVEMAENTFGYYGDLYKAQFGWREMSELNDAHYKAVRDYLKQSYESFGLYEIDSTDRVANLRNREAAYMKVLNSLYDKKEFPDGENRGFSEGSDISDNTFAIYDIDNDGAEELIINYITTDSSRMVKKIYGYDYITAGVREEFSEYPSTTIYDNGIIVAYWSHNHGRSILAGFWPYGLYQYNGVTDKYDVIAVVDAWDKNTVYPDFPTSVDKDGDGIVYCVMADNELDYKNAMDKADYETWLASYIGDAKEVELPYMELSETCLSIVGKRDDWRGNIVIDDNPDKTRDELAIDLMEAYRAYHASLPTIAESYFNELKIISLESYDESDSDPETTIGVITEDVLRFEVKYAVNAKNMGLAGSWDEGKGEYEGYVTNIVGVRAVRYNGKWYLTGMGNG